MHVRIGKAAAQVLALAAEIGADHILLGSHGKTGVERLLLGSVSEHVVREARCPVTVVRPKTYPDVVLMKVTPYEHARTPHEEPHVYSSTNHQFVVPSNGWPLG